MVRWLLWSLAGVAGLVTAVLTVGWSLPVEHRASRTRTFAVPPDRVFAVIADFARYPEWKQGVTEVDVSGDAGPGQSIREHGSDGIIPYVVEVYEPTARLVTRIAGDDMPFGGTWTYQLQPAGSGGTDLTVTEDGEVYNLFFRFMARFVFGHHATMDGYLEDLEKRLRRD